MKSLVTTAELNKLHNYYYREVIIENKRVSLPIEPCLKVGEFYFAFHKNDTCVTDCLKQGIFFEKFMLSYVRQFIDPNKNILDIGANIGNHTVVFSNYLDKGLVYSFEPQPVVYDILLKNVYMNKCDNVYTFNFGASNIEDTFIMNCNYDIKENQGAFRIIDNTTKPHIKIRCKPIDSMNLENVGFIKIDVEGHELRALYGLVNLIKKYKPIIMIEIHETSPTKDDVFKLLVELSYTSYHKLTHCDYVFVNNA